MTLCELSSADVMMILAIQIMCLTLHLDAFSLLIQSFIVLFFFANSVLLSNIKFIYFPT